MEDLSKVSPMMQHYLKTKEENPDCILFYRLGDFYEMFFDDAILVSKELELTLTGKNCGLEERAPMCGVPFHAADTYIDRLVSYGHKVAVCEQVEDPKAAKGIVKREVVRIVTPGTNMDQGALEEGKNNYLVSIYLKDDVFGLSACDVSTGDFYLTEIKDEHSLNDELAKYSPAEILLDVKTLKFTPSLTEYSERYNVPLSVGEDWYFAESAITSLKEHFKVNTLAGLGIDEFPLGTVAAAASFVYLKETQKNDLGHITGITPYFNGRFMLLDMATRRNLELCETMREKSKRGSLLWVLDKTKTAMGARLLRSFIEQPLIAKKDINERLDSIEELLQNLTDREEIREYLNPVYDLERLSTRIVYGTANPRDFVSFKNSISMLPHIKNLLEGFKSELLKNTNKSLDDLSDICKKIEETITDEPPISSHDGGIIREGFSEEVDKLRKANTDGKLWLSELEAKEREKTGIKTLRVKYNKVFGYYIEVTNSFLNMVPDYFIRKQTLTGAERYITPELKEMEDTILGASDRLSSLENELFKTLLAEVAAEIKRIKLTAKSVAMVDALCSLAYVAEKNNFVRPQINTSGELEIVGGRHPVVEKMLPEGYFIDNDTYLDSKAHRISIITGPNMAGKSTYMRQTALIVLMAQIGSFVPAKSANIGLVDRIFTRVGASDDLASGQSTFMVEMNEVANILRNATKNSLLILDEIGRGTSTFDGLAIAWAVVEHISNTKILGSKALFATHYHELTELEGKLSGVNNYCIAVKEDGDDIVFLRKIIPGGADKSYGIQVARLAGVPKAVTSRAKEIVEELLKHNVDQIAKSVSVPKNKPSKEKVDDGQVSLFDSRTDRDIIQELQVLDLSSMTPIDALNTLNELQSKARKRW